jgi:4-amino-4-deoxy-L-arabinose transferase-like glycosyltransferase
MPHIDLARYRPEPGDPNYAVGISSAFCTWLRGIVSARGFLPICFVFYMATRSLVLFIRPLEQSSDFAWYYERALEIASGSGYAERGVLTAFWPIGWPGFLAALFTITGPSLLAAQTANLVFAALVFALSALLATSLFQDRMVGRVAVLILSLYPNQIGYVPLLSTEIFYEFLLLFGIYLLMQKRLFTAILAGFVFGIGTLTKTQTLLLPVFVLFCVFVIEPSKSAFVRLIKVTCAVYIIMLLVILPWTYRNYKVFEAFIPVSTNGGWTLLTGNNPEANGD